MQVTPHVINDLEVFFSEFQFIFFLTLFSEFEYVCADHHFLPP